MKNSTKQKRKFEFLPYFLILPTFLSTVVFGFYPFVKTIFSSFSFTDTYGRWIKWAGTFFWEMTLEDGRLWQLTGTTMKFAMMNFAMTFLMGILLALLCVKKTKFGRLYQTIYALPIAISSVVASAMFGFIFKSDSGLLNSWLGTNISWFKNPNTVMWVISFITAWSHVGIDFILLLAGFRNVSQDVQEAATVDGANGFVMATKIMIPMASPQIFYVVFLNIITAIKTFTQIRMLTGGGPGEMTHTLMYEVFVKGSDEGLYEYSCCISIVLFLVIFITTRIQFFAEKKYVHYQ